MVIYEKNKADLIEYKTGFIYLGDWRVDRIDGCLLYRV